jgi:hypothetical protein
VWQVRAQILWVVARPANQQPSSSPPPGAISRSEFAGAVRQALRDYTRPERLAANPLLRPGALAAAPAEPATPAMLQALLQDAAASLTANPRAIKFHRALWHTYFAPAPTQEQAAELLDLPFNTYRYHLAKGITHVTEWMWWRTRRYDGH